MDQIEKRVGEAEVLGFQAQLERYIAGKANLDARIIENEDWWKLQHWKRKNGNRTEKKTSAWLFNSLTNKHADAMDNFPEPIVLPRERSDEATASALSAIMPVILDECGFEQTYNDNWWDKLKNGAAVYAVMWDESLNNGTGDISVKAVDQLEFYWEPGVKNIQESQYIFTISLCDNKILNEMYPEIGGFAGNAIDKKEYHFDDSIDTTDKSVIVDVYYKRAQGSRPVVHYAKYCGKHLIFASENEERYAEGFYRHGMYPFVMDVLYPEKGTPSGFGMIDIMRDPQEYVDDLGNAIVKNAIEASKRRYLTSDASDINEEELNDIERRIIHCSGSLNDDHFRALETPNLSSTYLAILQDKVAEIKETSGNRDVNQGSTGSGVTAASAISALQEAGSKGSRDIIKGSYRAYKEICGMIVELIRQFYDYPRVFRITGADGQQNFVEFDNSKMHAGQRVVGGEIFAQADPVYDIKIKPQRSSAYSRLSQNELALQLYQLGLLNPQNASVAAVVLDMMDFEGKEKLLETVRDNGTLYEQLQQQIQLVAELSKALAQRGDPRPMEALAATAETEPPQQNGQTGKLVNLDEGQTQSEKAADRAANAAAVK